MSTSFSTEYQIEQNSKIIDFIRRTALAFTASDDIESTISEAVIESLNILNADHAHLYYKNENTGYIDLFFTYSTMGEDFVADLKSFPPDFLEYEINPIIKKGVAAFAKLSEFPPAIGNILGKLGVKSLIIAPITENSVINGVLLFENLKREREWSALEVSLVSSLEGLLSGMYFRRAMLKTVKRMNRVAHVMDFLKKTSLEFSNSVDFNKSIADATEGTCRILGADHAHIYTYNKESNCHDLFYTFSINNDEFEQTLKSFSADFMETMVRPVIHEGVMAYSNEAAFPESIGRILKSVGVKSFIISPILNKGAIQGVILFEALQHEINWSDADVSLVTSIEGLIASLFIRDDIIKSAHETEFRMREMFHSTDDEICFIAKDRRITFYNNAFATQFDMRQNGNYYLNADIIDRINIQNKTGFLKVCDIIDSLFAESAEKKNTDSRSIEFWEKNDCYDIHFNAVHSEKGEMMGVMLLARNISARKVMEEELLRAKLNAEQASMAKSEFLSRMSHEIRTPMNAIIGMAVLAGKPGVTPEQVEKYRAQAERSSKHLLSVLNDILDISKIEVGKFTIENTAFNIVKTIGNVVDMLKVTAESKSQELSLSFNSDIPEFVNGDPVRISQVVTNLLSNAIKFTPTGGRISVTVNAEMKNSRQMLLTTSITDSGIGITPESIERLFDAFEQADSSTTRHYGGTGLGLTISKRIAKLMDGDITAVSELGRGSTFVFTAVLHTTDSDGINSQPDSADMSGSEIDLTGKYILIAEDIEINAIILKAFMESTNVSTDEAQNGQEAVEKFLANPDKYDAILMDIQMPVLDGFEATKKIRSSAAGNAKTIPIIAMTANVFQEDINRCLDAGMNGHLGKPVEGMKLYNALAQHLLKKEA